MSATNPLEERSDRRPRAVCLMGPTASGKTALAVALAERRGYAVISVDSALVYRGMDVGTAKPDPATLARDAGLLMHQAGYRCTAAGIVNMFPHTAHVESIAVFERG